MVTRDEHAKTKDRAVRNAETLARKVNGLFAR